MRFQTLKDKILDELRGVLNMVCEEEINCLIDEILLAKRVYFTGVGRVLLMSRTIGMRLMQMGLESYIVGDTITPGIYEKDLLIASSGSGETMTTVNVAKRAKEHGAKIALITAHPESSLGKIADLSVKIPCPTKLHLDGEYKSIQPMSNLFEQSLLLFFDCISIIIQEKIKVTEEKMWRLHTNLE